MVSFTSSLKSVFGGRASVPHPGPSAFVKSWPLFSPPLRVAPPAAELTQMVECEVIPRLIRAHRPDAAPVKPASVPAIHAEAAPSAQSAEAFARLALSNEPDALIDYIGALLQDGASSEAIYIDRLRPAARRLGEWWDEDCVSFSEVALGLSRLQRVVRGLGWTTPYNGDNDPEPHSALFCPRPGEEHTFGFYLLEEYFRWSGWRTLAETSTTVRELTGHVRRRWFNMLCLSVSREDDIEDLACTIKTVRRVSRNPELFILVSGSPFFDHPEQVATVGADAASSCGVDALHIADKAVRRLAIEQ